MIAKTCVIFGMDSQTCAKDFKPRWTLRENPLKRVLKSYVVTNVVTKYVTYAVRVLWQDTEYSTMWEKRQKLETALKDIPQVALIINSITAMDEKKNINVGFAIWRAYNWPEHVTETFENLVCRKFMDLGMQIHSCKSVKGRGKLFFFT